MKNNIAFGFITIIFVVSMIYFYNDLMAEKLHTNWLYAGVALFVALSAGYIFGASGGGGK